MYCTVIIELVLAFDKAVEKMVCVGQTADLVEPGPGVRVRVLRRCRSLRRTRAAVLVAGFRRVAPWRAPAPPPFPVATRAAGRSPGRSQRTVADTFLNRGGVSPASGRESLP